ncbi:hypothetical protein [Hymenobacter sp. UYP22]|uniref:hypothetical protein n=1 Tax=Hymenobacter sp. UYP22 TaxID=3156348 RepID=UPI00339376A8
MIDATTLELTGALPRPEVNFTANHERELPLTKEEQEQCIARALQAGRQHKYQMAYTRWYSAKMMGPTFPIQLNAEQYLILFRRRADELARQEGRKEFVIDAHNEGPIWLLCLYFARDERFETEFGYNLKKNLMLRGNVGCGKSTILSMFCSNHFQSFTLVPCRDVSDSFEEKGKPLLKHYYGTLTSADVAQTWGHKDIGIAFDDLGTENFQAQFMGNYSNPMAEVLSQRYDKAHTLPAGATHLTTNLMHDEIDSIYHGRVGSRIRDMFNDIIFDSGSPDRRG